MPRNFFNSARISEEHLAIALSQVALGFWEMDLNTRIIECTTQNRINLGLSMDEPITEQRIIEAILPEDRWRRESEIKNAMHPDSPTYNFEIRVRHADQQVHWLHVRGTVIFENLLPVRIIGTTIDVSKKKEIETLRDELLNITTHELKSPLSIVKGYLQLLYKFISEIGDNKHRLITERAISANAKIERLIEEIIPANQHIKSELILKKEPVDLHQLIKEVISNANLVHEEIQINFTCLTGTYIVSGDKYRISQVLTNLVNNAIKYSPGESTIDIELSGDASGIRVSIIDNGIGIAEQQREKVFQKFYRIANTSHLVEGSGIGLYLCAEIIAHHRGRIGMLSNPAGKGTIAFFELPFN
ncbi:MAG: PAS domain-containing sensor histidine kinase [Pedobacter agri]